MDPTRHASGGCRWTDVISTAGHSFSRRCTGLGDFTVAPGIHLCRGHAGLYKRRAAEAFPALPERVDPATAEALVALWSQALGVKPSQLGNGRIGQLLDHLFDQMGQAGRPHAFVPEGDAAFKAEVYSQMARTKPPSAREVAAEALRKRRLAEQGAPRRADVLDRVAKIEAEEPIRVSAAKADDVSGFAVRWKRREA